MTTQSILPPTTDSTTTDVPVSSVITQENDEPIMPVNLYDKGYEKAERHRGNAHALENLLNRVLRGYLVEERNDDAHRRRQQERISSQLVALEKQAEDARTQIRKINTAELPALRESIESLEEEIHQIRRDEAAGLRNPNHRDRVQLWFYGFLLALCTLFVFLFYVSAFYAAFYRDLAGELVNAGESNKMGVLSAIFAKSAYTTLDFHWAGPWLLFAFGGFLHVLYEDKTRSGRIKLGLMLAGIALTDGLIAYFVESKNHDVKVLMGLANQGDHAWWLSAVFWLVIMMGFVAALVWSGLVHKFLYETGKKDVARITALDIQYRRDKQAERKERMNALLASLADLDGKIKQIDIDIKALEASREAIVFSQSELEKYVTDFYDGWLTYVNNRMGTDIPLRESCQAVIKAFYERHLPDHAR